MNGAAAGLGALAANGGPTWTELPAADSPLLDAIPASAPGCTGSDQRGVARPNGGGCDIGAVELEVAPGPARSLAFAG